MNMIEETCSLIGGIVIATIAILLASAVITAIARYAIEGCNL